MNVMTQCSLDFSVSFFFEETKMEKLANEDELRRLKSKSGESEVVEKELREQV